MFWATNLLGIVVADDGLSEINEGMMSGVSPDDVDVAEVCATLQHVFNFGERVGGKGRGGSQLCWEGCMQVARCLRAMGGSEGYAKVWAERAGVWVEKWGRETERKVLLKLLEG